MYAYVEKIKTYIL